MAPSTLSPAQQLRAQIPLVYRVMFLWIDPIAGFMGFLMGLFFTDDYFETMSPLATPLADNAPFQVVFDQLAATYFLFAFITAVVLRTTSELRVWKAVLLGILCCDSLHVYATGKALGGLHTLVAPGLWRWQDWVNLLMLYVPACLRMAFFLEIGFARSIAAGKKRA